MLSFLRGDTGVPALSVAPRGSEAGQLLALETCFPLQRTVAFCSLLPGARLVPVCTPLQTRLLPAPRPQNSPGGGFRLRWSLPIPFLPSVGLPPSCYLDMGKTSPGLNWTP